jgi:hypothetical protein
MDIKTHQLLFAEKHSGLFYQGLLQVLRDVLNIGMENCTHLWKSLFFCLLKVSQHIKLSLYNPSKEELIDLIWLVTKGAMNRGKVINSSIPCMCNS